VSLAELEAHGFTVVPGPFAKHDMTAVAEAYDRAVLSAPPETVRLSSSLRVSGFLARDPLFEFIAAFEPLLTACRAVIGKPFALSSMNARTVLPGATAQPLHADVRRTENTWPLLSYILMIDPFTAENGATRFVPGSHRDDRNPGEVMPDPSSRHERELLACGDAGSMIIFHASVWHGFTANRSPAPRRSVQGAFIPIV
jgi:ectoine hydroxylase-related dioxygenase (phytanoyl-CoA dioxygenase family)